MESNVQKMREALELCVKEMCANCRDAAHTLAPGTPCVYGCETLKIAKAALAEPLRNSDVLGWREAWDKWRSAKHPQKPTTYKEAYDGTKAFMDWYLGPVEKEGGTK